MSPGVTLADWAEAPPLSHAPSKAALPNARGRTRAKRGSRVRMAGNLASGGGGEARVGAPNVRPGFSGGNWGLLLAEYCSQPRLAQRGRKLQGMGQRVDGASAHVERQLGRAFGG